LSFEDILRAARRVLYDFDVFASDRNINNLHQLPTRSGNTERDPGLTAA
jgi:hypothetical protein